MTIKHISFDVWNTLITANPWYSEIRTEIIAKYANVTDREAGTMYRKVKKYLDQNAEKGICSFTSTAWHVLGKNLNMEPKAITQMQRECEEAFLAFSPRLNEDLVDQLISLDDKYELSIKSNTNFISGRILSQAVGFDRMPWWSFMHFSDEHLLCKPDILFFAKTLLSSKLSCLANYEILHIGDSEIYDGKCVDLGFKFCHVKNPQDLLEKFEKGEIINA
ncbi:hydrolase [Klebsiella phage phi1_175008]|uniref:Hydrolase n=2 Tax=Klebsiella phage phi1_175008 TaxID=3127744 RepID=A0ACD5FR96_9CAUD